MPTFSTVRISNNLLSIAFCVIDLISMLIRRNHSITNIFRFKLSRDLVFVSIPTFSSVRITGGSRGGLRGLQPPPLHFQKRGVTSVVVVISTASTVSEQERNGQGRRDVGKSVHVSQAIMKLDAYHMKRGFVQKTANKVVYNDGKRILFAYPFLDVAALMDPIHQPIFCCSSYSPQSSPPQCEHISHHFHNIFGTPSSVSLALHFSF